MDKRTAQKAGNRAVIYARFSNRKQREESIEGQIRICTEFANKNDYKIVGQYIDRALTGRRDTRAGFQRMIMESAKRKFDYVLVYMFERFARNRYDSAIYKMRLKKNGVRVISALENVGDGPESIIWESMLEGYAEYYSADLSRKVLRGMTENALKGKWNGTTPLGYMIGEDKMLKINPATAPLVRRIFAMYAAGTKTADIITQVNDEYFALTGKKFQRTSFSKMFDNETYIGKYNWNGITTEGAVPAIIDKDVFIVAKERMTRQKRKKPVYASDIYMLTSKIKCGRCGAYMTGVSGKSRNGELHYYYTCYNRRKTKNCAMKSIKVETIEEAVIKDATEILSNEDVVEMLAEKTMQLLDEPDSEEASELDILTEERKETQRKLNNCLKALESGVVSEAITARVMEHEARLKNIDDEIMRIKVFSNPLSMTKERIMFFIINGLKGNKRREFILTALVKEIVLNYNEDTNEFEAAIHYNYTENSAECNNSDKVVRNVKFWCTRVAQGRTREIELHRHYFKTHIIIPA